MTDPGEKSSRRVRSAVAIVVLMLAPVAAGCTRPLLERAITARGGDLVSLSRVADAEVSRGFPGAWSWRLDYRVPDQLRWTIETYGEDQSIAFDGTQVRYYLGSAALPQVPSALADFMSIVRWTSVTTLDALASDPAVSVRELPRAALPAGAAAALEVIYRDDGDRYVLSFDGGDRLVGAEGPIVVPTIASGRMRATYADFSSTGGYDLPRSCTYTIDGTPFFRETVVRWVPNDLRLSAASFTGPPAPRAR
jgi:hypothetical protein